MKRVHDILYTAVLFSRIIHLTHTYGEPDYMVNLWRCSEELEKRGGQDKRRCRDCNENAIICSWTDIILLWNYGRCGDSKAAFSRLSIWIWLTTDSRRAIPLKYWVWITTRLPLMSLYWSPPRSTHLPGGNAAGGRTEKAVKQEKSNNIRGAISSVLEISHPLYRELATVRTRLTAVERKTRQEQRRPLFPFFPLFIMFSNISYMPLLHLWMLPGLQVCEGKKKKKKGLMVYQGIRVRAVKLTHTAWKKKEGRTPRWEPKEWKWAV